MEVKMSSFFAAERDRYQAAQDKEEQLNEVNVSYLIYAYISLLFI